MAKEKGSDLMEKIVSLSKRRGFIYQGSEIYGGLAGTWDYGPNGVALKNNVKNHWWKYFVDTRADVYGLDAAILMNQKVWQASGHIDGFNDPMVECMKCKKRFRADLIGEDVCPECGGELGPERSFNMMFSTQVGPIQNDSSTAYLRPETAGGIFTNFKNILDTFHPKIPFGIAQMGKAYRNEISPRDFLYRAREFEQMEMEWFCEKDTWITWFDFWQKAMWDWMKAIGIDKKHVHELDVPDGDLAHYSHKTIDFEYDFPFGRSELYGLAYRTDHDLTVQQEHSGVDLTYYDQEKNERFTPHVIEPSLGVDRTVLALLCEAYTEEEITEPDGEKTVRVVLKFVPSIAPVKVAVLPLMRKEKLTAKALEVYDSLKSNFHTQYDETASIGKRYRRQDEIGTPYCVTIDFDSLEDGAVTVRDRDTMKQERIEIKELSEYLKNKLN